MKTHGNALLFAGGIALAVLAAYVSWQRLANTGVPEGIASGNGRIE